MAGGAAGGLVSSSARPRLPGKMSMLPFDMWRRAPIRPGNEDQRKDSNYQSAVIIPNEVGVSLVCFALTTG